MSSYLGNDIKIHFPSAFVYIKTLSESKTGMGKVWPGGHMWPVKLLSSSANLKE